MGLLLFFTVLGLSSSVAVLEQDTRLKRFREQDLKLNLDALRRGIDLYRYKYGSTSTALETAMNAGNATEVANILAAESFIRARVATGSMQWKVVQNLIANPSFEEDSGVDYGVISGWRGNFTANDDVPDGWKLTSEGAEQKIAIANTSTYVVSFWARCDSATAKARLRVWRNAEAIPAADITASSTEWKRYFGSFAVTAPSTLTMSIVQAGAVSGDTVYIDGLMLEKWTPPAAGVLPVASAWTEKSIVIPSQAVSALQERQFLNELTVPDGSDPSSFTWWFQW